MASNQDLDLLCINTIRTLAMDAVQRANSGHPGAPMGLAPLGYVLWNRFLRFDPENPAWPARDRFVLSNGHASMLLWSLLNLSGVRKLDEKGEALGELSVKLEDIQRFRQWGSKATGHPEYPLTSGVETTTGPLGQGIANSVGMAIAQKWLSQRYDRPGFPIFEYSIYAIAGDGCLMEGIGSEAASLAGHLSLGNLCWVYDSNHISIDGNTNITFTEDVAKRFAAYGWRVLEVEDANDLKSIEQAFHEFGETDDRPTLIVLHSHIAYGAPNKQDTAAAHGAPLGEEEVKLTKRAYGWPEDEQFLVPEGVRYHFAEGIGKRGPRVHQEWKKEFEEYRSRFPELAVEIDLMQRGELPSGWDENLPVFSADSDGTMAGREASGKVLNVLAQNIPWLLGGSADLASSNKVVLEGEETGDFQPDTRDGRNIHFGVREHAMEAIVNGMALSKLRPFGATFFVFSDYARAAIRLSAIMELNTLFVFTHDAMGDGEDGPTHQPVEQLASMRAMPKVTVFRPADANEVVEAYRCAMQLETGPVLMVLSRQKLPILDRSRYAPASGVAQGAYVLADAPDGKPELLLLATGSEVALALQAHEKLCADGVRARVVSMPSWEIFEEQPRKYRDEVLPPQVRARVAIEQASPFGWERYVGSEGRVLGMTAFGASAPLKDLNEHYGFTPERVVELAREVLSKN